MRPLSLLLSFLVVLPAVGKPSKSAYRIRDLGGLEGGVSAGQAINGRGQVLGRSTSSFTGAFDRQAFLSDADLSLAPLPPGVEGVAINNLGHVVGNRGLSDACGTSPGVAFDWTATGGLISLPPLAGDASSNATAINDQGVAVGRSVDAVGAVVRAVIWKDHIARDLGAPAGSYGLFINNHNQVVGSLASAKKGDINFFLWTEATGVQPLPTLTRPGDRYSQAAGLSDNGEVIGTSLPSNGLEHAVIWDPSLGLTDVGALPGDLSSSAIAINAQGTVLGASGPSRDAETHYFLWDRASGIRAVTLPASTWTLVGLNDSGDLVGTKPNAAGAPRAFILRGSSVTELGVLGGGWSAGTAINAKGEVTGAAMDVTGTRHAFRWSREEGMRNVGDSLGGHGISEGNGIDDQGEVAGVESADEGKRHRSFVTTRGTVLDLGSLQGPTVGFSEARAISPRGEVVGESVFTFPDGNFGSVPYHWDSVGGMQAIPIMPEFETFVIFVPAQGVNTQGTIVGWGSTFMGERAWRWDAAAGMTDIGSLSSGEAHAYAVNDHEQIVGDASMPSAHCGFATFHAFRSAPAGLEDLGALPGDEYSVAHGINGSGDVVGDSGLETTRAFLFRNTKMFDLTTLAGDSSWALQSATGINDRGQITGVGLHRGQLHAYLLEAREEEGH